MDKFEELVVGNKYFVCFAAKPTFYKKGMLLSIRSDKFGRLACFQFKSSINEIPIGGIGIGETMQEAKKNYGKFK